MSDKNMKEISEFIEKSINQVKFGLPEDCEIQGTFDFDISLITSKENNGKLDIKLAGIGRKSEHQQVHRLRFSIVDMDSRDKNIDFAMKMIRSLAAELPEDIKEDD